MRLSRVFAFAALALASLVPELAAAQPYPNKPIKIVVPFTPGGSPDVLARTVAHKLQDIWGQPVIVENQPGAGGTIAAKAVAHAPADGYTWLVAPNSVLVFAPWRLRLLAGTGAKRYASLPQVPTVGEALPGFSVDIWSGFVAPANTPAEVISKANADIVRILAMPDVQAVLAKQGIEVRSSTPSEMTAVIKADLARWAHVVKEANIKAE